MISKILNSSYTFYFALIILFGACGNSKSGETAQTGEQKQDKKNNGTIILVHSAWLGAWEWGAVEQKLNEDGYNVIAPDLPAHGNDKTAPENVTMDMYVEKIVGILDTIQGPVVLLGHSFNGITISRVAELRPEKINKLVYLTAFLLPNGYSFFKAVNGVKGSVAVDNFYLSDDNKLAFVKSDSIKQAFAQDVPDSDFENAKAFIVPEPAAPLAYELQVTDANFGRIPKYYIECTLDNAVPLAAQRSMYEGKVVKSFSIASGHTPNFSQPVKLAEIIEEIASDN